MSSPIAARATGLRRELTFSSATALVISNMIGSGVFGALGFLAGDLGRPSLVLGVWLAGGAVALAGCLCYAELGINLPRSGGEYIYLRDAWGPTWGFLSGWVSFFAGFSAPIAATALLFAEYSSRFIPALRTSAGGPVSSHAFWHLRFGPGVCLALALIALFTAINIFGIRLAARAQNWLTGIKVATLGLFVALALTVGQGSWSNLTAVTAPQSTHSLPAQFAISLVFVMFAYSGWNAATYVAEEMKSPERTLPQALAAGTLVVTALYVALNAAFIYALPLASLKGVERVGTVAAAASFGPRVGGGFSAVMAAAILSCLSAMMIVGPRVYFAMARDGAFLPGAARIHARFGTPSRAILYQGLAASAMVVTASFEALAYYIGFALVFFAALAVAGLFRLRSRPGWKRLPVVDWGYPLLPALFIGASLWMLAVTLVERPGEPLWGLATILVGTLVYRTLTGRRRGPRATS
jgi:basic amino acid/polyamine antiporter, APA family